MRKIAVRTDGPYLEDRPLDDVYYLGCYSELAEELQKHDAVMYLTKDDRYYEGKNQFTRGWEFREGKFVETREPFAVDLIFVKDNSFKPDSDAKVLNHPEFDALCQDKSHLEELFPEVSPKTIILTAESDIDAMFAAIPSKNIVLKPLDAYGGQGVFIGPKEEGRKVIDRFPYLAQEFVDSSKGIPGLTETYHDFRIILMNGEIPYTFIRTPQKGSLISNVAMGGWMTPIPSSLRPPAAMEMAYQIDAELSHFGDRIYSVDCALGSDGLWKLIELNSPPGQQNRLECGEDADVYFETHARVLLQACD